MKIKLTQHLGIFLFAGIAWAMWKKWNKMGIERKFPVPSDALLSGINAAEMEGLAEGEGEGPGGKVAGQVLTVA